MEQRILKTAFEVVLSITLFSLWAAFALLVVNPFFHENLPGYRIGRICIWELIALLTAIYIARRLVHRWGSVRIQMVSGKNQLTMHPKFGIYFVVYFILAVGIGIWQFWKFSQGYPG